MATETDNRAGDSENGKSIATDMVVKVGDGGKIPRRLKMPANPNPLRHIKHKKRAALYVLLIIAILIGGWLLLQSAFHVGEKVYAQAAGHKIYKEEVKDLIGKTKGVSDHDAATVLADKYLIQAMVKDKNITVTDKELVAKYGKVTLKQKKSNEYAYQNKQNQLYFSKLEKYNSGIYKGKFLIANFSRHLAFYPILPEDKLHDPELGSAKAIAKDRKYAQDFITNLYNDIKSGKITFDQAIKKEHQDPKIGLKAYPTQAHSGSFDTSKNGPLGVFNTDSVRKKINDIKQGTTTKPFAVSVNLSVDGTGNETGDSYFLVIRMDKTTNSYTGLDYSQYIKQEKKSLGYKVYV